MNAMTGPLLCNNGTVPLQRVELKASRVVHVGACDNAAGKYALAKKKMSYEYLRNLMHLRPRTNVIGSAVLPAPRSSACVRTALPVVVGVHTGRGERLEGGCGVYSQGGAQSRRQAALRSRRAVARIRNALARATHDFFQAHGFLYVHTPIITTSDCEGAGEMFQVPALLSSSRHPPAMPALLACAAMHGGAVTM